MITKKLVQQYEGDIVLKSAPGKGTQITIIFKIIEEEVLPLNFFKNCSIMQKFKNFDYRFEWKPSDNSKIEYVNNFENDRPQDSFNLSWSQNES